MFASTSLALRHAAPCACAFHSISSPAHTLDRPPPRTSHLHAATATPLASLPSTRAAFAPTGLLSHQNSLQDALLPTPTSPQTSPPLRTQTSLSPLLVSSSSPICSSLFPYSKSTSFLLSKKSGMHPRTDRAACRSGCADAPACSIKKIRYVFGIVLGLAWASAPAGGGTLTDTLTEHQLYSIICSDVVH